MEWSSSTTRMWNGAAASCGSDGPELVTSGETTSGKRCYGLIRAKKAGLTAGTQTEA